MFRSKNTLILFALLLSTSIFAQAPAIPDSTFNGNGRQIFQLGSYTLCFGDNVAIQADGKIIMTGACMDLGGLTVLGVARINPDGSLDTGFGTGGSAFIDLGELGYQGGFNPEIFIQPNGRIVICGFTQENSGDDDMFVCRLMPDGALDGSFGTGGKVWVNVWSAGMPEAANAVTVDNAGNIYACGSVRWGSTPMQNDLGIIKLNSSGQLDLTFSDDGKLTLSPTDDWEFGYGIKVMDNGNIVVAGYAGWPSDFMVIRLLPNGNYDPAFGTSGYALLDMAGTNTADECLGMAVSTDGKIILAGSSYNSAVNGFSAAVARLNSNGTLDNSFSSDGKVLVPISNGGSPSDIMYNVLIQPDGKYLVSGQSLMNGNNDFAVIRLDTDGTLDSTFSQTGIFTIDVSGQAKEDFGYGLALQPDGKLILSGYTEFNQANNEQYSMIRLIAKEVLARFSANPTLICAGQQVNYTDQSLGSNLTYNWIFEGGTPATSTAQNPTVTYLNPGFYNTWLIVTNGSAIDTLIKSELIEVRAIPAAPATPSGQQELCGTQQAEYTTHPVDYADSYNWIVTPASAGLLTGTDTTVIFSASSNYSGPYTIKAQGVGLCGTGTWSAGLTCQLNLMPTIYSLTGEGEYCIGEEGAAVTLSGSEQGTDYELYHDGEPTGLIQSGSGIPLTWDDLTDEGVYTVTGYTDYCSNQMSEQVIVTAVSAPDLPEAPEGTSKVCSGGTYTYSVTEVVSATSYIWQIDPSNAGEANGNEAETEITWNSLFSGPVELTVIAVNSCGTSAASPGLAITVDITPSPAVSGPEEVCLGWTAEYLAPSSPGSSYVWTVEGGSILTGAGTAQISVLWNTAGTGSVVVEETSQQGCTASSDAFPVLVDPCTGLEDSGALKAIMAQPNPFRTGLNIHLNADPGHNAVLMIYDVTGTILALQRVEYWQQVLTVPALERAAPGIYFIRLSSSSQPAKMIRVIKM